MISPDGFQVVKVSIHKPTVTPIVAIGNQKFRVSSGPGSLSLWSDLRRQSCPKERRVR